MISNIKYFTLSFFLMALSACSLSTPSEINHQKARLVPGSYINEYPLSDVSKALVSNIAHDYDRYGDGAMELSILYNPKSKTYTAQKAHADIKKFQDMFRLYGVKNIQTSLIASDQEKPKLVTFYNTIHAAAPEGCYEMPGLKDSQTSVDRKDYKLGCGVETHFARQVYRPADMAGSSHAGSTDGRRGSNIVEQYRTGVPAEPLEGTEREDLSSN